MLLLCCILFLFVDSRVSTDVSFRFALLLLFLGLVSEKLYVLFKTKYASFMTIYVTFRTHNVTVFHVIENNLPGSSVIIIIPKDRAMC